MNTNNTQELTAVESAAAIPCESLTWNPPEYATDDVKSFLEKYYADGLVYLNGFFWAYSSGYWAVQHDHADVQKSIAEFYSSSATPAKVIKLFGMLRLSCIVKEVDFQPNTNYICFQNGALNLRSFELVPHSPHFHLRSGRPVDWDENATSPRFEQFLQDIFGKDEDRDDKIQFVKEWMGLCLIPDTSFEKFVVCVGEGGNGKSVLLKLMPELVGADNVYSAPIERLGNRRALAELAGKLLLTSSEINENSVMDDGILKQIVSGDTIEGERKYGHPFTFTPTARIMLATNHLPKLRDVTQAFFRRLVVLRFNRNFTAEEMDLNLTAKLKTEMAGIFAVAVNGLKTLQERGQFIVPKSSEGAATEYREYSDLIKLFADDSLIQGNGERMKPASLYALYKNWASAYGFVTENNITFGKRLKQLGFEKKRANGIDYWLTDISAAGHEVVNRPSAKVENAKPVELKVA